MKFSLNFQGKPDQLIRWEVERKYFHNIFI